MAKGDLSRPERGRRRLARPLIRLLPRGRPDELEPALRPPDFEATAEGQLEHERLEERSFGPIGHDHELLLGETSLGAPEDLEIEFLSAERSEGPQEIAEPLRQPVEDAIRKHSQDSLESFFPPGKKRQNILQ